MENPSSNTPDSFDYSSLPPLTSQSIMQNVDFFPLGSSSSSSFPLFDDYYSQTQQDEFIQQHQLHQPSSSSHPFPSSSTYPYPNIFSLESSGGANQHYYNTCSNLDQMGTGILHSWFPFNIDHIENYGGLTSSSASSSLPDVAPHIGQQQRPYGPTISSSTPASIPSSLASLMHHNQNLSLNLQYSPYTQDFSLFPSLDHLGYRFVLQKELKNSDVNNIGRIVLPKRESESNLPFLSVKEGIQLSVMELFNPYIWRMRYRFWPNNKSRMYVLENTGEFIRRHGLRCGDYIALYQDMSKQLYICSRRLERPFQVPVPSPSISLDTSQENPQIQQQPTTSSGGEPEPSLPQAVDAVRFFDMPVESTDNTFHFTDPSPSFFDIASYNSGHFQSLPNIEDCDLSIFDADAAPEKTGDGVVN